MVNLDEVDQEIADWQSKLAAASDSLITLYDHPTYKRLDNRSVPLTGATAALVTPALAAMNELFAQMGLLTDVVDRAAAIRHGAGRFAWTDKTVKEIQSLLRGPSIKLPSITIPLEQRGLLTSAEHPQTITPDRMLAAMTQAFEAAKSAVLTVDKAWERLDPVLAACDMKLAALSAMAKTVGDDATVRVAEIQRQLDGVRSISRTDPLSGAGNAGPLQASLEQLRVKLEALAQERNALRARLDAARGRVASIKEGRIRADAAAVRCRTCIDKPIALLGSISDKQMTELEDWLTALKSCERQGHSTALCAGLDRWEQLAREYEEAQQAAVTANEGLLEALAELNGRFSAIKFKTQVRGFGGRPAVAQAERLAGECLGRPLVPLDQAAKLVADYESQVSAG